MPSVASGQTELEFFGDDPGSPLAAGSHDSGTGGSNRCLVQRINWTNGGSRNVTAVTYNAISLTNDSGDDSNGGRLCATYVLVAPATGSNAVSVTITGTTGFGLSVLGHAQTYDDVDQTTPTVGWVTANGAFNETTVDVTSTASDDEVIDNVRQANDASKSPGTGQTEYADHNTGGASLTGSQYCSDETGDGGTITMNWTTNDNNWITQAGRLQHSAAGPAAIIPDRHYPQGVSRGVMRAVT